MGSESSSSQAAPHKGRYPKELACCCESLAPPGSWYILSATGNIARAMRTFWSPYGSCVLEICPWEMYQPLIGVMVDCGSSCALIVD